MFERFTEKARRVIFFARYEASQFGSPSMETEHLLLGILREDKGLSFRLFGSHAGVESIRKQIEGMSPKREKISTSVDLPLTDEAKQVLLHAIEESESMHSEHVETYHLMLGLLRQEQSLAFQILRERGVTADQVRDQNRRVFWNPEEP
ncbi:MAG TPA: Clp protease N-terminal domain-containing protein [Bryobacteraceae bacterium]|nr:Clp protease N-terminal domain-containing protein [Bryobacteraceae bacterium]